MKRLLLAICTFSLATVVLALPRTYTVHVLVFSHLTPQTVSAEQWPLLTPMKISPATDTRPSFALAREAKALAAQPDYRILFNGEWRLTWARDNQTITIPLSNGIDTQGNLNIALNHYFDIHADIFYAVPLGQLRDLDPTHYFDRVGQSPFIFMLSEDRRMKSQELNYLAMPVIGVLIEITK